MVSKSLCVIALVGVLGVSSFACSTNNNTLSTLPWAQDFEKPELLTVHFRCGQESSEYKSYLDTPQTFTGITMKFKGGTFYVYSSNPNSMSPITESVLKSDDGKLHKVSQDERDRTLANKAPLLYKVMQTGSAEACTILLDGTEKDGTK